jgi:hypothetical protein
MKIFVCWIAACLSTSAQVPFERIRQTEREPGNWLTYSGNYNEHRYSLLDRQTREGSQYGSERRGNESVSQRCRLDQLVQPILQPGDEIVLCRGAGARRCLLQRRGGLQTRRRSEIQPGELSE